MVSAIVLLLFNIVKKKVTFLSFTMCFLTLAELTTVIVVCRISVLVFMF
jgi:hypothetical protein